MLRQQLNAKQLEAFQIYERGENVFVTGMAGTGKSFWIKAICHDMNQKERKYSVTATTGSAAVLIEGTTLHRWAGIGQGKLSSKLLIRDLENRAFRKNALMNWRTTDTLIVDEISMMDADLFDKLDEIGRALRGEPNKPFGGIQLIVCGDFAQLPPVKPKGGLCFESKVWNEAIQNRIEFTDIIRQSEAHYKAALGEIRMGIVTSKTQKLLRSRVGAKVETDAIKPTRLMSKRMDTDNYNERQIVKLDSKGHSYACYDRVEPKWMGTAHHEVEKLKETFGPEMQARENLKLKVGAQVMLIYNRDNTLVNGSRGVVTGFTLPTDKQRFIYPIVKFMNGQELVVEKHNWKVGLGDGRFFVRSQIPLILAWAMTAHRSQGATLDCVKADISDCFDYGQAYVVLSRVRSLEGLSLKNNDLSRIMVHPKVKKYYES